MNPLRPVFHDCADPAFPPDHGGDHDKSASDAGNSSESSADRSGTPALEMRDSPFASLMRRIERMLDSGLAEDRKQALNLVQTALKADIFEPAQQAKLTGKVETILDMIRQDNWLGAAFVRPTLGLPAAPAMTPSVIAPPVIASHPAVAFGFGA